jgi:phosphoserine aminotransferase
MADMSSDILSRPFPAEQFSLIYAGAQKNLGPAGVTVVIIRKDMAENNPENLPTMLRYQTYAKNDSLYNTPPVFSIYMVGKVLKWIKANGGLSGMAARNEAKAGLIYDVIDKFSDFFQGHAEKNSRSRMNITFRLPNEELEATFVKEASVQGMLGLKGHRSVGGLRASIYNGMPEAGCRALADFMVEFMNRNS